VWTLDLREGDGRYSGRADDVVGTAVGEAAGNALRWRYVLALPVDGKTWSTSTSTTGCSSIDDKVMLNRSVMSEMGLPPRRSHPDAVVPQAHESRRSATGRAQRVWMSGRFQRHRRGAGAGARRGRGARRALGAACRRAWRNGPGAEIELPQDDWRCPATLTDGEAIAGALDRGSPPTGAASTSW
jgi:hypothetical protein